MTQKLITCANRTGQAVAVFFAVILTLGVIVALIEGWSLTSSDWWHWAVVTASTTGYGDLAPETWGGRLVGDFVLIPVGLVGIGVIVGRVAAVIIKPPDAWEHEEQEQVKKRLDEIAERLHQ